MNCSTTTVYRRLVDREFAIGDSTDGQRHETRLREQSLRTRSRGGPPDRPGPGPVSDSPPGKRFCVLLAGDIGTGRCMADDHDARREKIFFFPRSLLFKIDLIRIFEFKTCCVEHERLNILQRHPRPTVKEYWVLNSSHKVKEEDRREYLGTTYLYNFQQKIALKSFKCN